MTEREDRGDSASARAGDRPRPRPTPGGARPRPTPAAPSTAPRTPADAGRAPVSASDDVSIELLDFDDLPTRRTPVETPRAETRRADAPSGPRHAHPEPDAPMTLRKRDQPEAPATEHPVVAPADPALARFVAASEPQPEDDQPPAPDPETAARRSKNKRRRSVALRTLVVLVVAGAVALLLRAYVVEPYYIPSESMEPTLHGCSGCTEDHVLVDKISYRFQDVHAGDIVVFHKPKNADVSDDVLIKRVIAIGGDTVTLRKDSKGRYDGKVYVNGLALEESYVNTECGSRPSLPLTSTTSWKIPKGDVFVMGDNRCHSEDSRAFGPITTSSVIGRAVLIIWPLDRFGGV